MFIHTTPQEPSYLEYELFHGCPASVLGARAKEIREEFAFAVPVEVACRH
jgi:hypothetical protein